MASIGRGQLRCKVQGCSRVRPYWADECKRHRKPVTAREAYESDLGRKDQDITLDLERIFQDDEEMNEEYVEACFKCGWLSTTGPHLTCSRQPVRLYTTPQS